MTDPGEVEFLLIEDNENDAEMTIRALRTGRPGFKYILLKDGAEALDYLHGKGVYTGRNTRRMPQLILLDLKMPKVDGLEILKEIKTGELTCRVPVVVLTSSKENRDIERSYLLGANSYIVKPIDFEEYRKVMACLGMYWLSYNQPFT